MSKSALLESLLGKEDQEVMKYLMTQFNAFAGVTALRFAVILASDRVGEDPENVLKTLIQTWRTDVLKAIFDEIAEYEDTLAKDPIASTFFDSVMSSSEEMMKKYEEAMDKFYPLMEESTIHGLDALKDAILNEDKDK